ncbi:hypothetical protein LEMLEM_LOCUS12279 [Lemmus lemmus]
MCALFHCCIDLWNDGLCWMTFPSTGRGDTAPLRCRRNCI